MKIGILTHYDVNNQGAQLQLYATYNLLRDLGHDPLVLTYNKNFDFSPESKLRNQISIKSVPYIIKNFLFAKGFGLTWHNVKKYRKNKKFRSSQFSFGSYATSDIDAAIVGADEVWSLENGCNMMMYGHGVNTSKIIAYAPSMGQTDIDKIRRHHCEHLISSGISSFSSLSSRDASTSGTVKALTGLEPPIVCDPALLYKFPLSSYTAPRKTPKKKYLVIYGYDRHFVDKDEVHAIRSYARANNLITVSPGTYHKWCDKNISCHALEWLKIIHGAEAVITDTFHGTIAAIITGRPVAVYVRQSINSNKLTDLISRLGLEPHQMSSINEPDISRILSLGFDSGKIDPVLNSFRDKSIEYLLNSLD